MNAAASTGLIGPNSIIQTVAALEEIYGPLRGRAIRRSGKPLGWLDRLPDSMVNERQFHALVETIVGQVGAEEAGRVLHRSGQLTAGYLLSHRIPRPMQALLRVLPRRLGLKILLSAIRRHAWTFAGSGSFDYALGDRSLITLSSPVLGSDPAVAGAVCHYYRSCIAELLKTLVDLRIVLVDLACQARRDQHCRYQIVVRERAELPAGSDVSQPEEQA